MSFHLIRHRLRTDFRLAILTMMGIVALAGITPFGLMRASSGQWEAAAVDLCIVSSIVLTVIYSWWSGNTQRACQFLVYANSIGGIAAATLLGISGAFWLFPLFASNFFLVERKHATSAAIIALAVLLFDGRLFDSLPVTLSFITTALIVCILSYIFAYRSELQRQQLEALAARDSLTGVFNRRSFKEELERSHHAFERDGASSALLVLDLDHFKEVNDTWGHDAGDQVLMALTKLVEKTVRRTDRLFRYGGEEFVLLISPASLDALASIAENICQTVRDELSYRERKITVSIGGALLRPTEKQDAWFARADAALYRAKRQGRNQAVIDGIY